MRVCIVRQFYFPSEAHVRRDVNALLAAGYEVDVVCARDSGERAFERWGRVGVYRLPVRHIRAGLLRYLFEYTCFFMLASLFLSYLHIKMRYRVIEVDTMPDFLVFATIIPRIMGARIVLYMFEDVPTLFSGKYDLSSRHPIIRGLRWIERIANAYADRVIVTFPRDDLPCRSKVTVVLNVPDESIFNPRRIRYRPLPTPNNIDSTFRIVMHSTLTEVYGIQNVIRALALVRQRKPGVTLTVYGDGEYKPELIDLARQLGVESSVAFAGHVPYDTLPESLVQGHAAIISMLCEVLLPNKLFESVALGIPVICVDYQAIRTFFPGRDLNYYPADDIPALAERIISHFEGYGESIVRARSAYARYESSLSWQAMRHVYLKNFRFSGVK